MRRDFPREDGPRFRRRTRGLSAGKRFMALLFFGCADAASQIHGSGRFFVWTRTQGLLQFD